jgi:hypothetical protein
MGKRGRSLVETEDQDEATIVQGITRLKRDIKQDIMCVKNEALPNLIELVRDIELSFNLSEENDNSICGIFNELPEKTIDKMVEEINKSQNKKHKLKRFSQTLFPQYYNIIKDAMLKLELAESLMRNTTEYLLRLAFSRGTHDIYWSDVIRELTRSAKKCGERNAQQQAQQLIQNMQQQANQAIQQAQQQALQAQGNMQI